MTEQPGTARRLAAILAADVAGFARLMEADEAATLAALDGCRALFRDAVAGHGGRLVDMAGDSVLAVFPSVVEAVACARDVQAALALRAADADEGRRMRYRVGVNLGDVIEKADGSVYGDGINVAARLQALAAPGGVVISGTAHDHVEGKTGAAFAFIGEQTVKNIARPVRAYRLTDDPARARPRPAETARPSIAVLAFDNLSGDADQEYFADGIAEDLTTALSRLRWLFVVARNSSFTYKGRAVDVKRVGAELGVRYVVEGSVRRGGERVRVSVQLIDAATGTHVWAERYDRALDDLFALQDEIAETVAGAIAPELEAAERERAHRKPPGSLDAWDAYQRGMWHLYRFTAADNLAARRLFEDAIARDADFAPGHAGYAYTHFTAHLMGYPDVDLDAALAAARRAVAVDDRDAMAHFALGRIHQALGQYAQAVAELSEAVALNPNFAHAHFALGFACALTGDVARSHAEIDLAERQSPRDPILWAVESTRAIIFASSGDYERALAEARKASRRPNADVWAFVGLAIAATRTGRDDEAQAALAELRRRRPDFTLDLVERNYHGTPWARLIVDGLAEAGFDIGDRAGP